MIDSLESWVITRVDSWRDHYEANYSHKFDEYYRLWRGIWAAEDKTRDSERSRIISPALQQAVESSVAEVEEATFGRGRWFDIEDDDPEREDIVYLRNKLFQDFKRTKTRKSVAECLINAAVFGTGIGEIVLEEINQMAPATQPVMEGGLQAVGVNIRERVVVRLRPVMPQNFLIDPVATSVDDALGVAIDEFVPLHQVEKLQRDGVYKNVELHLAPSDFELEPDKEITSYPQDKVRLTKYYGLVPSHLLEAANADEEEERGLLADAMGEPDDAATEYVEACIVIANGGVVLKAEPNPYMMQDRPVIAFPWDVVPGRFWGRGVCEKGYNSQKALDAELRARIDALALTVHPMMGVDATRMPKGNRLEVRPGKMILMNGRPSEIMEPFNFGRVDQITFAQAAELQKMVQTATGAIDSAGIPGSINGEATAAGISMSLGAIIKRHKRTLINFQESFIVPLTEKTAWRYMQYDPENYPVNDYSFIATSSLGIIAREYEVTQLVQLLQTMPPDNPIYSNLITSIIDNMNISNREELVSIIEQASQPSPEEQQAQQAQQQAALRLQEAQTAVFESQAQESQARARKYEAESLAVPYQLETDRLEAIIEDIDKLDTKDFAKRKDIVDRLLKERQIAALEQRNSP